ncbi:hypothetical protein LTR95_000601 [Oleoguttula sp. CCFEE 5521]
MKHDSLPSLQFGGADVLVEDPEGCFIVPGADVLIKTSESTAEWPLVHSAVLAAASEVFKIELTGWGLTKENADIIFHPVTGKEVKVKVLELCVVEDTFLLVGKPTNRRPAHLRDQNMALPALCLAVPWWPENQRFYNDLPVTTSAIRVLLALIYGAKITHKNILWSWGSEDYSIDFQINGNLMAIMATTAAYAEYYQCLPVVRDTIAGVLTATPGYWVGVGFSPKAHALLAIKLENEKMFNDAMRHLIAQAGMEMDPSHLRGMETCAQWEDVAEVVDMLVQDVQNMYGP